MRYTKLGNSDLSVSRICLGCMGFGKAGNGQHSWTIDKEHSREIIQRALELAWLEEPYVPPTLWWGLWRRTQSPPQRSLMSGAPAIRKQNDIEGGFFHE